MLGRVFKKAELNLAVFWVSLRTLTASIVFATSGLKGLLLLYNVEVKTYMPKPNFEEGFSSQPS